VVNRKFRCKLFSSVNILSILVCSYTIRISAAYLKQFKTVLVKCCYVVCSSNLASVVFLVCLLLCE
jgi:hypothetical protein